MILKVCPMGIIVFHLDEMYIKLKPVMLKMRASFCVIFYLKNVQKGRPLDVSFGVCDVGFVPYISRISWM